MNKEEVFKIGLGYSVVYPKWHKNGKDRYFRIRGYELGDSIVSLTDGLIKTKVDIESIEPIPLTEDILLKCGLLKTSIGTFLLGSYELVSYNNHYNVSVFKGKICELSHLHQLQNLYFALTGEELNLQL